MAHESIDSVMKQEPKELATFASQAYMVGVREAMAKIAFERLVETEILQGFIKEFEQLAFRAVEYRKSTWIDRLDHSISPSKTYISMPIEEYDRLKALDKK